MGLALDIFGPAETRLLQECIHCGLCLPTCPTYAVNGREADSPRGRLVLMKAVDAGQLSDDSGAFSHLDLCLGCRACETACPSGIRYGTLLEKTRDVRNERRHSLSSWQRTQLRWLTGRGRLGIVSGIIRTAQRLGLLRIANSLHLIPRATRLQSLGLPEIPPAAFSSHAENEFPAAGIPKGKVALFTGCVMDRWYRPVHEATVRVLQWNGFTVQVPRGQVCCGALHSHGGWSEEAERMLGVNREQLRDGDLDAIIVNAAGCGAQLKEKLWEDGGGPPVLDVAEWLLQQDLRPPVEKIQLRVVYDAPCHLYHAQGVQREPLDILDMACEHRLTLTDSEMCCGGAGLYSLKEPAMATEILQRKIARIRQADPAVVVTGNPGCALQLQAGLRAGGLPTQVVHTVEMLDRAYQRDAAYQGAVSSFKGS